LGGCISDHFTLKIEEREREDVINMLAGYYRDSEPLDNMVINFGCTPARSIESLPLAHGVTWWAFARNLVGFFPELGGLLSYQ